MTLVKPATKFEETSTARLKTKREQVKKIEQGLEMVIGFKMP